MKIRYLDISDVGDLTDVYNHQFSQVPHCYPVSKDEFVEGFPHHKCSYDIYKEDIHSEKIIISEESGRITGFGDVAIAETQRDGRKDTEGFIRFLTYETSHRQAGQAILGECERYLAEFGVDEIKAFRLSPVNSHCGYRFYHLGYNLISNTMCHVCALLSMNGYKKTAGEIFLNWSDYRIDEPVPPDGKAEIILEFCPAKRADLPGLHVKPLLHGKQIGVCESNSAGEYCQAKAAQDWMFIGNLYIVDKQQGKGWGRYILQRNLWEMQKVGYRNTAISTDWVNYRAQLFYTNYGYKPVDTCYEFAKNLS